MTEEEEETVFTEEDDSFLTEEELFCLSFWRLEEPIETTEELLLDPIASLQDDEESSSEGAEVPLSPPQAARAMVSKRTIMDPIALCAPG